VCNDFEVPVYSIGKAAEILNISVHTLRMYEKEGLIVPFKKTTSHRLYSRADIEKVNCLRNSINEKKLSIAGIKVIFSLIPCWDIIKCSDKERKACGAFNSYSLPCWTVNHKDNICAGLECRDCKVYKDYADCHKIKDSIKKLVTR
jgi:MerR family transcriptional regulator, heat shock protein HspR